MSLFATANLELWLGPSLHKRFSLRRRIQGAYEQAACIAIADTDQFHLGLAKALGLPMSRHANPLLEGQYITLRDPALLRLMLMGLGRWSREWPGALVVLDEVVTFGELAPLLCEFDYTSTVLLVSSGQPPADWLAWPAVEHVHLFKDLELPGLSPEHYLAGHRKGAGFTWESLELEVVS